MKQILSILVLATVSVPLSSQNKKTDRPIVIEPTIIIAGSNSKITKKERSRITNDEDWQAILKKHLGEADISMQLQIKVDYSKYMIIAIFDGELMYNTFSHVILVEESENAINLRCDSSGPQIRLGQAKASDPLKNGYCFVVLPNNNKEIIIDYDMRDLIADPPKWVEHYRIPAISK